MLNRLPLLAGLIALLCMAIAFSFATTGTVLVTEGPGAAPNRWPDLWIENEEDHSCRRQLLNDPAIDKDVAVSPDGRYIAWASQRVGISGALGTDFNIYVMDIHGYNIRQMTAHTRDDERPAWSLDGRFLYFESDRNRNGTPETYRIRWNDGQAAPEERANLPTAVWRQGRISGARLIEIAGADTSWHDIGVLISGSQSAYIYISGCACNTGGAASSCRSGPELFPPCLRIAGSTGCKACLSARETHVTRQWLASWIRGCSIGSSTRLEIGLDDPHASDNSGQYVITIIPDPT